MTLKKFCDMCGKEIIMNDFYQLSITKNQGIPFIKSGAIKADLCAGCVERIRSLKN